MTQGERSTLGEQVKAAREAANLTQKDLAEAVWGDRDMQGGISRIETGGADVRASTIAKIAEALGMTVSELTEGI